MKKILKIERIPMLSLDQQWLLEEYKIHATQWLAEYFHDGNMNRIYFHALDEEENVVSEPFIQIPDESILEKEEEPDEWDWQAWVKDAREVGLKGDFT